MNSPTTSSARDSRRRGTPFAVNNFEHRHAAQQKILEMQQKQIQEQQKLIEELQYLQRQQMLQQQLLQQESVKANLTGQGGDNVASIHNTLSNLQSHIARLQKQLTANASGETPSVDEPSVVQDISLSDSSYSVVARKPHVGSDEGLRIDLSEMQGDETRRARVAPTLNNHVTSKQTVQVANS